METYLYQTIEALPSQRQLELVKKISHVISDAECMRIAAMIRRGSSILEAHLQQGIFKRYTADILRFLDQMEL